MYDDFHGCSDGLISFNCFPRTEEHIRLKLSLQQSIASVVGGSQKVLIKYQDVYEREPNLTGTKLEMNLRPDTAWYPLEPAATSFNFITPLPSYQDVVFRLKGQSGNEIAKSTVRVSIHRSVSAKTVSFVCPPAVWVDTYFNCNLSVAIPNEARGRVTWDEQFNQEFTIPGKFENVPLELQ
ncbi:hypothetical protein AAHC03_017097 [Spirometra sp. Aus1]